jgi:ribosome-associated protein
METHVSIKNGIIIPIDELEITISRSSGPGGQHVNKAGTRVTIRWNVKKTRALQEEQKERVLQNLSSRLTENGDLIIHNSRSRSQRQNKDNALTQLANIVRKALYVPKKRVATKPSKTAKQSRLQAKAKRSFIKKLRRKQFDE